MPKTSYLIDTKHNRKWTSDHMHQEKNWLSFKVTLTHWPLEYVAANLKV